MSGWDRACLTLIVGAGCFCWFRYPAEMASAILTLAVLGMLVLSVEAMRRGAKRLRAKTRKPPLRGNAGGSLNTHSLRIER